MPQWTQRWATSSCVDASAVAGARAVDGGAHGGLFSTDALGSLAADSSSCSSSSLGGGCCRSCSSSLCTPPSSILSTALSSASSFTSSSLLRLLLSTTSGDARLLFSAPLALAALGESLCLMARSSGASFSGDREDEEGLGEEQEGEGEKVCMRPGQR